ncbi:MAG: hypothetical protein ACTSO9_11860 [Candidatus Helarchaeota archaeon]
MDLKINEKYTPMLVLFLFILGMFMTCLTLVSGTGNLIYLILIVIPAPFFIVCIYVLITKIRKED